VSAATSRTASSTKRTVSDRRNERAEAHVGARVRRLRHAIFVELTVRREHGLDVAGHIQLGNQDQVLRIGERDQVRVLLLRVKAARSAADLRFAAHARQLGPRFELDAPALIVGQMQMKAVELVIGGEQHQPLHLVYRPEMPRDVEREPTPSVRGRIFDPDFGQAPHGCALRRQRFDFRREQLSQRHRAVKGAAALAASSLTRSPTSRR